MKPIGRLYFNKSCISGYIVIGEQAIKFASENKSLGNSWIYLSKKQQEEIEKIKEKLKI